MILIQFSKAWGQDEHRWNYCGGDLNFATLSRFMSFYGIKESWITGIDSYLKEGLDEVIFYNEYSGYATKELDRIKKHWYTEYCKPSIFKTIVPQPLPIKLRFQTPT